MKTRIKKTYICNEIKEYSANHNYTLPPHLKPKAGDVGIFEIIKIGKHKVIQTETKRNAAIIPGDLIMAAFGNRYATAQFEGYVPDDLNEEMHILGVGGVIGVVKRMHKNYIDIGPTIVKLVSVVTDDGGEIINTKNSKRRTLAAFTGAAASATKVILSVGSSMDSGKTTTAAYLVNSLKKTGYTVAYIKLTGTAYTKDCDFNYDLGADVTADFTDFGFPSTYLCEEAELFNLYESLLQKVIHCNPDYTVIEIADGLYQRETKMLLSNNKFKETVHSVLFSAGDSLAAINGLSTLNALQLYPFAVSGLFTASPMLVDEVKSNTSVPVLTLEEICQQGAEILCKHIDSLLAIQRKQFKIR